MQDSQILNWLEVFEPDLWSQLQQDPVQLSAYLEQKRQDYDHQVQLLLRRGLNLLQSEELARDAVFPFTFPEDPDNPDSLEEPGNIPINWEALFAPLKSRLRPMPSLPLMSLPPLPPRTTIS